MLLAVLRPVRPGPRLLGRPLAVRGRVTFGRGQTRRRRSALPTTPAAATRRWAGALTEPLPPLPRRTRVLLAVASERHDFYVHWFGTTPAENHADALRAFYGASLAGEVGCDGTHLEVGVRCATNREPAFTERLALFLAAPPSEGGDTSPLGGSDEDARGESDDDSFATASEGGEE